MIQMDVVSPHVNSPAQNSGMQGEIAGCHGDGPALRCCRALRAWLRMRGMTLSCCSREKMGWGAPEGVMGQGHGSGPCSQAEGSLPRFLLSPEMILLNTFCLFFLIYYTKSPFLVQIR